MCDPEQTIGNLIDKQSLVQIGSIDEQGFPAIKAMFAPRERDGIRTMLLTTNASSERVAQFRVNPKACLYACDRRWYRGVMLQGTMEVLEDAESKRLIWREGDDLYYPEGVDDPDYCVLRFTAERGRYYSNLHSEDFEISE